MNSFIDGSAFCPGAPKRVPSDSEKQLRVYTPSHVCHGYRQNSQKTECVLRRPPIENKIAGLNGHRSEQVKTSAEWSLPVFNPSSKMIHRTRFKCTSSLSRPVIIFHPQIMEKKIIRFNCARPAQCRCCYTCPGYISKDDILFVLFYFLFPTVNTFDLISSIQCFFSVADAHTVWV